MKRLTVGVIGAGTMGAGIGLTGLLSGHEIILCDVSEPVKERALAYVTAQLAKLCTKGKLEPEKVEQLLASFRLVSNLEELSGAEIVIEAIPEKMELKKRIFQSLDEICAKDTILATNTSSLSVTVIASATNRPDKIVGCHFFNPAPVMKLVEIVRGEDTSNTTVEAMVSFAKGLGKTSVVCKDTPGFVVNRVARNFYGEALRIVGEGSATIEQVDMLLEQGAGFRMGPFRLMDLIGIDVNLDVTEAVYHANYEEARFRPHPLQSRMVDSGRLGRKSGRGFYRYHEEEGQRSKQDDDTLLEQNLSSLSKQFVVIGDTPLSRAIAERIAKSRNQDVSECGLVYTSPPRAWDEVLVKWRSDEIEAFLRRKKPDIVFVSLACSTDSSRRILQAIENAVRKDTIIGVSLAGLSATKQASWLRNPDRVRGFGIMLPVVDCQAAEWTIPYQCSQAEQEYSEADNDPFVQALWALRLKPVRIRDGAGGIQMRVLSMIFNEAAYVIHEEIASPQEVDNAMRLGTNYPQGPAEWMDELGIPAVLRTLEGLKAEFGEDRYRPSVRIRYLKDSGNGILTK
jgi:3-hydroxybutyryl-CoA dehydrogenase